MLAKLEHFVNDGVYFELLVHIDKKLWGFVDFKMAANEDALTQPKFELGITGIIHNVFQGD